MDWWIIIDAMKNFFIWLVLFIATKLIQKSIKPFIVERCKITLTELEEIVFEIDFFLKTKFFPFTKKYGHLPIGDYSSLKQTVNV